MKTTLDTTDRGLTADVLPRGTSGRYYTLTVRTPDRTAAIEIDATTEGLGVLVAAVLEQFDDQQVADLIANEVGARTARELGHALVAVAEAREQADRVGVQR
jgi:hypothetical protein